jgi:hypothetical protein
MSTLDQIHESIDAHIAELQREIAALEAARAALRAESPEATTSVAPKPTAPRRRRRRNGKPASNGSAGPARAGKSVEVLLAGKLEAMLSESEDGLSAVTISKRSNAGYSQVLGLLRELESSGQVRRSGTRRTSLWRVVTDEERIAERAAELEALSAAKTRVA